MITLRASPYEWYGTTIENIKEAIPILNTQKYKERPALAGVALYEKLFGILAAVSGRERFYDFNDQWCKEQFLEYMITNKDLTYTHFPNLEIEIQHSKKAI